MILTGALPKIKTFLRPAALTGTTQALLVRLVTAFLYHPSGLSAAAAAGAIKAQARHRAQLVRFLARQHWSKDWAVLVAVADLLLRQEARSAGTWLFLLDQTYVGQQGQKTQNTFSRANYRPRSKQSGRKHKKHARRSCHGFVCGLLLTPSGLRIPCCRCYYTQDYCQARTFPYRTQVALAATLVRELAVPPEARVVVLGDTAFEAQDIQTACAARGFAWVVPVNPERVLAGPSPRPKVWSRAEQLSAEDFQAVRLVPGRGAHAAQRRAARCRVGPKASARTYYAHGDRRVVHHVGDVLLVFSTKDQPQAGQAVRVQKVLMTNAVGLSAARVIELYNVRWQIELFFKELKSTLGFARYRFRDFRKVEGWAQACLVAFCYLEWYRARQLARLGLAAASRRWWASQRSYGLGRVAVQQAEEADLARVGRLAQTQGGRRKLRHLLREALPLEYRKPA